MAIRVIPTLVLVALAAAPMAGQDKRDEKEHGKETGKHARFEQFKQLAGEWVGKEKGKGGFEVHVKYKVTAGGSAVVETLFPGTDHEMVTVIHRDGDDLLLTHYCMLGNQPQMKAPGKGDGTKVAFKFVRATNLKSEKEMHMRDATYTFVSKDTLRTEWTHYKDGKAGDRVVFELKRRKAEKSSR
jgi:hypothetical protein